MSDEQEMAELSLFFREVEEKSKITNFAIPPRIYTSFLGKEGLYPFWLVFKAGIDQIKSTKPEGEKEQSE